MYDDHYEDDYPADIDDDEAEVVDCPACGAEVYEDAPQCPVCGEYITHGARGVWSNRPVWWVLLGLAGILAVTFAMTFH